MENLRSSKEVQSPTRPFFKSENDIDKSNMGENSEILEAMIIKVEYDDLEYENPSEEMDPLNIVFEDKDLEEFDDKDLEEFDKYKHFAQLEDTNKKLVKFQEDKKKNSAKFKDKNKNSAKCKNKNKGFAKYELQNLEKFDKNLEKDVVNFEIEDIVKIEEPETANPAEAECILPNESSIPISLHPDENVLSWCPDCSETFTSIKEFNNHNKFHRKQENKPETCCHICHRNFSNRTNLRNHLTKVHKFCLFCKQSCQTRSELEKHKRDHRKSRPLNYCNHCPAVLSTKELLRVHILKKHPEVRPYKCEICGKSFKVKQVLTKHKGTHDEDKPNPFHCKYCPRSCRTASLIRRHLRTHGIFSTREAAVKKMEGKKGKSLSFACKLCDHISTRPENLKIHMNRIHDSGRPSYTCKNCPMKFVYKWKLELHLRAKHNMRTPYYCIICQKYFVRQSYLAKHLKTHGPRNFTHSCTICSQTFTLERKLRRHVLEEHTKDPPTCRMCGGIFSTEPILQAHGRFCKKKGSKPMEKVIHWCELCLEEFDDRFTLSEHLKGHECEDNNKAEERELFCKVCNVEFISESELSTHCQEHAEENIFFECTTCPLSFTNALDFRKHMVTHTKDNAYDCPICFQIFDSRRQLGKHKEKEHNRKTYS